MATSPARRQAANLLRRLFPVAVLVLVPGLAAAAIRSERSHRAAAGGRR